MGSRKLQPCGTEAAYFRHRRHGEEACRPCLDAHNHKVKVDRRTRPGRKHRLVELDLLIDLIYHAPPELRERAMKAIE